MSIIYVIKSVFPQIAVVVSNDAKLQSGDLQII